MGRFDRQIATAQKLIEKNGESVVWRTIDDPEPEDPAQPWNPGAAEPINNDVFICFLPVNSQTMKSFTFMTGTEVAQGAVMGLMGAVPFEANLKDVVIRNGEELRVDYIDVLSPNGQKILYTMVFQR